VNLGRRDLLCFELPHRKRFSLHPGAACHLGADPGACSVSQTQHRRPRGGRNAVLQQKDTAGCGSARFNVWRKAQQRGRRQPGFPGSSA